MNKSILVMGTPNNCMSCDNARPHYLPTNTFVCKGCHKALTFTVDEMRTKIHPQCPLQPVVELLEALEKFKKWSYESCKNHDDYFIVDKAYNKLYKALGGKYR